MRILIIGGTRFIGLAVTRQLHAQGHTLAVFNRGRTPADLPAGLLPLLGDVDRLSESAAALRKFAPEVVLHNIVLHAPHVREVQTALAGVARKLVMTSSMRSRPPGARPTAMSTTWPTPWPWPSPTRARMGASSTPPMAAIRLLLWPRR